MRVKHLVVIVALAMCALLLAPTTFAQNLVNNGSFETGDFTGWTLGGNSSLIEVTSGSFYDYSGAQDGRFYVVAGPVGSPGTLSQTIADSAGAQYTLSFWFGSVGDNPSEFSVSWDGTQLLDLVNPNTGANWTQFTFQVTGTGNDTLQFSFRDDPGWLALDNVSLTENSGQSVPEPSSFLLLGTGVLGLGGMVRRKLGR
jgi:hypothetical protein